jgi:hypothetical protein
MTVTDARVQRLQLKSAIERKIPWLRASVVVLALAVAATAVGTIFE